jgi:hypothetical protein
MRSPVKNTPPLERELRRLLNWLCAEWGFCIPPGEAGRISQSASLSAEEFATAVLVAEGMNPEYEREWFRNIKRRFAEEFGSNVSEAGHATGAGKGAS